MYTEKDFEKTAKQTKNRIILGSLLICVFLGFMIFLTVAEIQVWQMVTAGAGFIVCYFVWSLKIVPWIQYNKFLKELRYGQRRTLECEFRQLGTETRQYDNVEVRDVLVGVRSDDPKEVRFDEKLFILDAEKQFPKIEEGTKVRITSFGNFITDIEQITA